MTSRNTSIRIKKREGEREGEREGGGRDKGREGEGRETMKGRKRRVEYERK